MKTEELLDRLEKVKRSGQGWTARCPSHVDRESSLSVKEREDGMSLLHCFAGCNFRDICAALGVDPKELSGNPHNGSEPDQSGDLRTPEAVYPYVDETGTVLYEVCRYPGKKFRQRNPAGEWNIKGIRRVIYNLPEVIKTARAGGTVYVVEGEKDVESLRKDGKVGTCNMGGGGKGKWDKAFSEFLRGAFVIIVRDKDETGRDHADEIKDSLVGARGIALVQAKRGKDYTDHREAGFTPEQLVPVRDRRMTSIVSSSEMADRAISSLTLRKDQATLYTNPWGLPEFEFGKGRLYVGGGWTSDGKSVVCGEVYRHLSEAGMSVLYVTNEMIEEDLRNRLLCHKGFNLRQLEKPWEMPEPEKQRLRDEVERSFRNWSSEIVFDTTADHKKVADYLDDGAYDYLIFDHLHRIESGGDENAIAREMRGFTNLALNYQIPVLLVSQLRRPQSGSTMPRPTIHDFKGSSAIEQEAAIAFYIWRVRDPGGILKGNQAELGILKHRHGERDVQHQLIFHGAESRFEKGAVHEPVALVPAGVWG